MFVRTAFQRCLLAALLVGTSTLGQAQTPTETVSDSDAIKHIIMEERGHALVCDNLEYLSDHIGPRLTGSKRLKAANDWTAAKMKEYGLENVHLEGYTIPRGWERGTLEMKIVKPNGLPVPAAQMAWTPGTRGKVSGPVLIINAQKEEDLAAYKGKLKGAIVMTGVKPEMTGRELAVALPNYTVPTPISAITVPPPDAEAAPKTPPAMPSPAEMTKMRAFRKTLSEFLKTEGVTAVLSDAGKPHSLLNMTGSWSSNSTLPTIFVSHEYVAMLVRLVRHGEPVSVELKSTARMLEGPITVYNTVGEIKGSEKPDEIVLLGAHLDSWDLGTGSTDNGTGSMAVLEAARLIKESGAKPKRTMRFVLFSGEEEGLFGSKAYVEAHKAEMPNVNVVFVHDTGTGRVKGAWLQERAECRPMLEAEFAALKDLGLTSEPANLLPNKMNGTDHASFDDAGVPAFAFNQDSAEYGLTHHSQSDTFDKVRPDDLKQGACVLAILGLRAAQSSDRYPRAHVSQR